MQGQRLTNKRLVLVVIAIVLSFAGLYFSFTPSTLVILLNGLFIGAMAAIGVTFHRLLWDAWANPDDFNRVRQMTLTIAGQWLVIMIWVLTSVYTNAADMPTYAFASVAFARYLATIVAIFQVTAPDYGDGLFYGADRKFLGLGLIIGTAIAMLTVFIQGA